MRRSQEIQVRLSELRQRANELTGKPELTDDESRELQEALQKMQALEIQFRAAVTLEEQQAAESREANDGTAEERRSLAERVSVSSYMLAGVNNSALTGAELELAQSRSIANNDMPFDALEPLNEEGELQTRADVTITEPTEGIPQSQAAILQRVFAQTASAWLGVSMPVVPVGTAAYPVMRTGASGEMAARGAAIDSEDATFDSIVLKPLRLGAPYRFPIEDTLGTLRGLEAALRSDLSSVIGDRMDRQVLLGNGASPNVAGFLGGHADGMAIPADAAIQSGTDVSSYPGTYLELFNAQVDGKYAIDAGAVRALVNVETYRLLASKMNGDSGSDMTILQIIQNNSSGVRVSANTLAEAANQSAVLFRRGPGAAVAPFWGSGVRFLRDEITQAAAGLVRITASVFWNFQIRRKENYGVAKVQTSDKP